MNGKGHVQSVTPQWCPLTLHGTHCAHVSKMKYISYIHTLFLNCLCALFVKF